MNVADTAKTITDRFYVDIKAVFLRPHSASLR